MSARAYFILIAVAICVPQVVIGAYLPGNGKEQLPEPETEVPLFSCTSILRKYPVFDYLFRHCSSKCEARFSDWSEWSPTRHQLETTACPTGRARQYNRTQSYQLANCAQKTETVSRYMCKKHAFVLNCIIPYVISHKKTVYACVSMVGMVEVGCIYTAMHIIYAMGK